MGEIHDRLDSVDEHVVARSRIELWIAEFVLDAGKTPTHELRGLIKEWFGATVHPSFSTARKEK